MSEFSLSSGESRVVVLIDDTLIILASDQEMRTSTPPNRRQRAIAIALLEVALDELKEGSGRAL